MNGAHQLVLQSPDVWAFCDYPAARKPRIRFASQSWIVVNRLRRHTGHRHFVLRLIDCGFGNRWSSDNQCIVVGAGQ
jgi:hypothetical protein